jgi:hypothetical protein
LIKIINFENKKYYKVNPCYVDINDKFILSKSIFNMFKSDLVKNILYFLNNIEDEYVLESVKPYISEIEYQKIAFKINPDKYYEVFDEVLSEHGIYLLYHKDELVYIGKSSNIKNRVQQHKKDKDFDNVKCILFKDIGNINLYEPYLIQKYNPKYNKDLTDTVTINLPEISI